MAGFGESVQSPCLTPLVASASSDRAGREMELHMSAMGMAVITGASSGMGKIYSQRLASRGYDLLLVARNVEQLQRQAEELQGGSASFYEVYPLDLSSRDGLGGLVKRIASDQKITMVVNAAGLVAGGGAV